MLTEQQHLNSVMQLQQPPPELPKLLKRLSDLLSPAGRSEVSHGCSVSASEARAMLLQYGCSQLCHREQASRQTDPKKFRPPTCCLESMWPDLLPAVQWHITD